MGRGLIEPVDEITDSTVASNPELMDYLTQLMVDQKFSIKSFLRVLYNTDAYQRTASPSEVAAGETYHFTGPLLRRMSAEQVWDSMVTLAHGNLDHDTSEENERLHQYLGGLKQLIDAVRQDDLALEASRECVGDALLFGIVQCKGADTVASFLGLIE
mgnify:CR=1 FL=1